MITKATVKFFVISRKKVLKLNVHGFTVWQLNLIWCNRNLKKIQISQNSNGITYQNLLVFFLHFQWNVHAKLMLSNNTGHILSLFLSFKQNLWKCELFHTTCNHSMSFQLKVSKQLATTQLDKVKRKNWVLLRNFC